jgi:hypothetical protein
MDRDRQLKVYPTIRDAQQQGGVDFTTGYPWLKVVPLGMKGGSKIVYETLKHLYDEMTKRRIPERLKNKLAGMAKEYIEENGLNDFQTTYPTFKAFYDEALAVLYDNPSTERIALLDPSLEAESTKEAIERRKAKKEQKASPPTARATQPTTFVPPKPKKEKKKGKPKSEEDDLLDQAIAQATAERAEGKKSRESIIQSHIDALMELEPNIRESALDILIRDDPRGDILREVRRRLGL